MPTFSLSPATRTVVAGVAATINLTVSAPSGSNQSFGPGDGGAGGSFAPVSAGFLGAGATSLQFMYINPTPGTYTITITAASVGDWAGQVHTAQVVVVPAVTGSGGSGYWLTTASGDLVNLDTAYRVYVEPGGRLAASFEFGDVVIADAPHAQATLASIKSAINLMPLI